MGPVAEDTVVEAKRTATAAARDTEVVGDTGCT